MQARRRSDSIQRNNETLETKRLKWKDSEETRGYFENLSTFNTYNTTFISRLHFPVASWLSTRGFQIKRSRVQLQPSSHNFNYNIYWKNESSSIADCFNINRQQWQKVSTTNFGSSLPQTVIIWDKHELCFIRFLSIHTWRGTKPEPFKRPFSNIFQSMFEIFDPPLS